MAYPLRCRDALNKNNEKKVYRSWLLIVMNHLDYDPFWDTILLNRDRRYRRLELLWFILDRSKCQPSRSDDFEIVLRQSIVNVILCYWIKLFLNYECLNWLHVFSVQFDYYLDYQERYFIPVEHTDIKISFVHDDKSSSILTKQNTYGIPKQTNLYNSNYDAPSLYTRAMCVMKCSRIVFWNWDNRVPRIPTTRFIEICFTAHAAVEVHRNIVKILATIPNKLHTQYRWVLYVWIHFYIDPFRVQCFSHHHTFLFHFSVISGSRYTGPKVKRLIRNLIMILKVFKVE